MHAYRHIYAPAINPLNAELYPICHFLALLGAHHILHVSWVRVKHKLYDFITGDRDRAVYGVGLRPLACWDCGFESLRSHECLS
jgi:hypothetical protein